jgi:hypothetical protein
LRLPPIEAEPAEKPLNPAVGWLGRRSSLGALTIGQALGALQIDRSREPLLIALLLKKSLQPPQLPDKRGLLQAD